MLFDGEVTIFHLDENDNITKYVFNKSYTDEKVGLKLSKGTNESDITTILILYQDNIDKICVGDLIVLEKVDPLYTLEREIRQDYTTYIIQSIRNCKRGNIKHYELTCK